VTRRTILRVIYALAVVNYTVYGVWYVRVFVPSFVADTRIPFPTGFETSFWIFGALGYLQIAAPLAILAIRPMWWGKLLIWLLALSAPLSWPFYRFWAEMGLPDARLLQFVLIVGMIFLGLAIIQQFVDPTLWRPMNTWLSKECPPPRRSESGPKPEAV
jgi:hypothetical protein